jgi:3-carboxy-cis,cis-muconate cycloisomerase
VVAAAQAAELVAGLRVDTDVMSRRAVAAADRLLAERGEGPGDPSAYLGASDAFVEAALARFRGARRDA